MWGAARSPQTLHRALLPCAVSTGQLRFVPELHKVLKINVPGVISHLR